MNIKPYLKTVVILACLTVAFATFAETTPRWVKKGVTELEKNRSNNSYSFHVFHQSDIDKTQFNVNPFLPLFQYVDSTYHIDSSHLVVDSLPADGQLPTTYIVSFNQDGQEKKVYARLVDRFQKYESYPDGSSDYNFYQLYAISNPGFSTPDFDRFSLKRRYGSKPLLMSIIPGLGQIYKGQTAKGYSFMGVEAAMIASIIYATNRVHHWVDYAKRYPEFYDSYQSKASTFRQWRTLCFIAGGGLYIYNLFDAALSQGARYVEVKRNNNPNMQFSFIPVFSPDMLGLGININL